MGRIYGANVLIVRSQGQYMRQNMWWPRFVAITFNASYFPYRYLPLFLLVFANVKVTKDARFHKNIEYRLSRSLSSFIASEVQTSAIFFSRVDTLAFTGKKVYRHFDR